ncbi:MAG: hypothetical protein GY757_28790, partial [bacterium]|nr:hypothetical protein [bacterium]
MSDDLNIIKSLQYKKKLELENLYLDNIFGYEQGYATDQHGRIVGLNLHLCGLIVGGNISRLLHLTHLDLSENRIAKLRFLENLKNLTHLHLTDNKVKDIEELAGLENLNLLYLNENPIKDYSPLKKLKKLTHLYLNSNQITDFSFLEELTNLKVLNLSRCNLELLHNLEKLKKLTHLYLSGNKIKNIEHLIELKHLKRLDLRFNRVDRLPREIVDMKMNIYWTDDDKDGVLLKKNPIDIPPIEILNKGNAGVKNYLKSLFGKNQALNEVKVLLVGDGGSGKTSLTRRLCGDPFNKNEPQTHGINIKLKDMGSNKSPIKAHYWDFGGQEILHATHQF